LKKFVVLIILITAIHLTNSASAKFQVPIQKESNHWKLELLNPPADGDITENEKGKFEMYGLKVINNGEKAYNVRVEAFRNEAGTDTMFGLAPQMTGKEVETAHNFTFVNFPIKSESNKLEIVVTWEDKPSKLNNGEMAAGRKYKETFVITN
jgi:hypothetical protein